MNNKTKNRLTKYEKSRLIGLRAQQISMGSPLMITQQSINKETDPVKIAELELIQRKIPMVIKRTLPDGTVEILKLEDMIID
jgi:DNA-directed RNA polymerase I, II, and III subunit RPABC2